MMTPGLLGLGRCHIQPEAFVLLLFLVSCASVGYTKVAHRISDIHQMERNKQTEGNLLQLDPAYYHRRRIVRRDAAAANQSVDAACHITCLGVKQRPVCAADGLTYSSKCELRRLRDCQKKEIKVVSKGRCPGETKCQEDRRTARFELSQKPGLDIYVPECKADGRFLEMQCHNATGYCWCVTSEGKPIPGSSVEGRNEDCFKIGWQKPRTFVGGQKHRRGVGNKGCSPASRSVFNTNLIKRFNEEYMRAPRPSQNTADVSSKSSVVNNVTPCQGDAESCTYRGVVEWKFAELDTDKDNELKRKELKTLKILVNKLIEPYACALTFLDYCDRDNSKKITLHEWSKCLQILHTGLNSTSSTKLPLSQKNKPGTNIHKLGYRPPPPRVKPGPNKVTKVTQNKAGDLSQKRVHTKMPLKETFFDLKGRTKSNIKHVGSRPSQKENEQKESQQEQTDSEILTRLRPCEDERQKAKEMDRADPDGHIFIPECEPNGMFKKAQCHNSTGYCWCVDDKTGIPIPGISTHNVTPDCSNVKANRLKGCPFLTKKRFLTELLDQITQEMVERANNDTSSSQLDEPDPDQSIEERAVRWKLVTMDINHNNVLEKSELKDFREEIKQLKGEEKYMRKCQRNFLQYCDDDNDSKITMDEWVGCMGLNEQPRNLPENPKRRGMNPFSTVLKSN